MNRRWIIPATALTLLLAACGSSSSSSSTNANAPATPTARTAPTQPQTQTQTKTVTQTAATPTAATPQCVASHLALTLVGQQGGMGHGELGFALRNTGAQSCRTGGYPGILFLDRSGRPLPTNSTRITQDFFGSIPVTRITLAPGQTASFRLGTTHEAQGNATCTTASALQVIPPNDTATVRTAIANGGAYECQAVTVSPLRAGASAYP